MMLVTLILAAVMPREVNGQTDSRILDHEKYCQNERAKLNGSVSAAEYHAAIANIQSCASIATLALAAMWERPQSDTTAVRMLGHITGRIRDQRLFDAVVAVAQDPTRSRRERVAAYAALVQYFNPGATISASPLLDEPGLSGFAYIFIGWLHDVSPREGAIKLRSNTPSEVLRVFLRLSSEDPDMNTRAIAKFLGEYLPLLEKRDQ